jgi:predicted membrane chloride channel (bestrophin family)
MLNRCRDITRQGLTYIPRDQPHLRAMLCRWVPAFPRALMCHLRKDSDFAAHLKARRAGLWG